MVKLKQLFVKYRDVLMTVGVLLLYMGLSLLTVMVSGDIVIGAVVTNILMTIFAIFYCYDYPWKADKSMRWQFVPPVFVLLLLVLIWLTSQLTGIALSEAGIQPPKVLENTDYPAVYLLLAILLAPVVEELLFRAILYRHLKDQWNPIVAAVISSVTFALMHGNLHQGIPAFLSGIFFALVYHLGGGLFMAILCHASMNLLTALLAGLELPNFLYQPSAVVLLWIVLLIVMIRALAAGSDYSRNETN